MVDHPKVNRHVSLLAISAFLALQLSVLAVEAQPQQQTKSLGGGATATVVITPNGTEFVADVHLNGPGYCRASNRLTTPQNLVWHINNVCDTRKIVGDVAVQGAVQLQYRRGNGVVRLTVTVGGSVKVKTPFVNTHLGRVDQRFDFTFNDVAQAARDQAARDQAARDQAARDQAARDQAVRDQAVRDQQRYREQRCYQMVQGRIAWNYDGDVNWNDESVRDLCRGSRQPNVTIDCFIHYMEQRDDWQRAVNECSGRFL